MGKGWSIGVNGSVAEEMAATVKNSSSRVREFSLDVFDERYYPPRATERELVARYFLVVVALDHRLSRPGKPYEACIDDGCYHGADLLYRLASKAFMEDPGFFSPERLELLGIEEFKSVFNVGGAEVPDPEVRVALLRDLGRKLSRLFNGSAEAVIARSRLKTYDPGDPGFIESLRVFRAFEDPVEKKAFLLAKFIEARGLVKFIDRGNKGVPVDNHLTRIALRTGLVTVRGRLWDKIVSRTPFTWSEDVELRLAVRRAYKLVSELAGVDPFVLDDFLWVSGRKVCLRDGEPRCSVCLFNTFCRARRDSEYMVSEHYYYDTWYY